MHTYETTRWAASCLERGITSKPVKQHLALCLSLSRAPLTFLPGLPGIYLLQLSSSLSLQELLNSGQNIRSSCMHCQLLARSSLGFAAHPESERRFGCQKTLPKLQQQQQLWILDWDEGLTKKQDSQQCRAFFPWGSEKKSRNGKEEKGDDFLLP